MPPAAAAALDNKPRDPSPSLGGTGETARLCAEDTEPPAAGGFGDDVRRFTPLAFFFEGFFDRDFDDEEDGFTMAMISRETKRLERKGAGNTKGAAKFRRQAMTIIQLTNYDVLTKTTTNA